MNKELTFKYVCYIAKDKETKEVAYSSPSWYILSKKVRENKMGFKNTSFSIIKEEYINDAERPASYKYLETIYIYGINYEE